MWIKDKENKDVWISDKKYLMNKTKEELIEIIYNLETQINE